MKACMAVNQIYIPNLSYLRSLQHAIETENYIEHSGIKYYYLNNSLHREDGPAIDDGINTYWITNGLLHREVGPAIELGKNAKYWFRDGKLHREDGPAIIYNDKEWYYFNGMQLLSKEDLHKLVKFKAFL